MKTYKNIKNFFTVVMKGVAMSAQAVAVEQIIKSKLNDFCHDFFSKQEQHRGHFPALSI